MFFGANLKQNAFEVVVDSVDGVSEPTVIFNKNFPKIRVPVNKNSADQMIKLHRDIIQLFSYSHLDLSSLLM